MKGGGAAEPCPCESGRAYAACCGPFHAGTAAPTPEALMRSRYSAYVRRLTLYLLATWHPDARPAPETLTSPDDARTKWLGLKIVGSAMTGADAGTVEFVARYRVGGASAVRLHEVSRFVREHGLWYYVDGEHRAR